MKRAVLGVLIFSLVALPMFGANKQKVTTARCASLEHVTGGWRMVVHCDQGRGVIVMLDAQKQLQYLGEGMFAGWSQQDLNAVYRSALPIVKSESEILQLG